MLRSVRPAAKGAQYKSMVRLQKARVASCRLDVTLVPSSIVEAEYPQPHPVSHRTAKRVSIYLEPALHRALRRKAALTSQSVSEIVNNAVRRLVREDRRDLDAFRDRAGERTIAYETLIKKLEAGSKL